MNSLVKSLTKQTLRLISDEKTVVPHGVLIEAYKHCPSIVDEFFSLTDRIWTEEKVSTNFVRGKFIIFFKNKGSPNNTTKYRYIGHEYKVFSYIILNCLLDTLEIFLKYNCTGQYWAGSKRKKERSRKQRTYRTRIDYYKYGREYSFEPSQANE